MSRTIDSSTLAQITGQLIYGIWIIRLDIANDPVYIHTGFGNLVFTSGYDSALNGHTFTGVGNVGSIDPMVDTIDGSQAINLTLPGVDLTMDYLHQIINNADLWQRRQAWIFFATTDSNFNLIGKPIRIKTARMDQMPIVLDPANANGTLTVTLESLQAYNDEASFTRYAEQVQVDATDNSCSFMQSLANQVPEIGVQTSTASGTKTAPYYPTAVNVGVPGLPGGFGV